MGRITGSARSVGGPCAEAPPRPRRWRSITPELPRAGSGCRGARDRDRARHPRLARPRSGSGPGTGRRPPQLRDRTPLPSWSLALAAVVMVDSGRRHLVVCDGGDLVGVLSMRDVVRCWTQEGADCATTPANGGRASGPSAGWKPSTRTSPPSSAAIDAAKADEPESPELGPGLLTCHQPPLRGRTCRSIGAGAFGYTQAEAWLCRP